MRKWIQASFLAVGFFASVVMVETTSAGESLSALKLLLKKGLITEAEYTALVDEQKTVESEKQVLFNTKIAEAIEYNKPREEAGWADRTKLSGLLESEYRWMKFGDPADKNSGSASDLYVRRLELGIDAELTDWIKMNSVINSEWIGDPVNEGDEMMTVDAATITLQREDNPLYLVVGKRPQPFGVFENHLVTDPMTQDAFETKRAGVTVGATGPLGLDMSATFYKGAEQMDHLFDSGLFAAERAGEAVNNVSSYVISAALSPVEDSLTLFAAYLSEPGAGSRNNTLNVGLSVGMGNVKLDGEYMKALKRELFGATVDVGLATEHFEFFNETFREGVLSATLSYTFNNGDDRDPGGATLEEERSHILEEPLEVALRYERYDDDGLAEKTSSWSAKSRYSFGARYPIFRDEENELAAYVAAEYRHTDYRLHDSLKDVRADNNREIFVRLGAAF